MSISVETTPIYPTTSMQTTSAKTSEKADTVAANVAGTSSYDSTAAVYEKSQVTSKDSANKIYNRDAVIAKLKADQDSRAASLESLVQKLLGKQAGTSSIADGIFSLNGEKLAEKFQLAAKNADADTIAQAQKDVAEDGYWGVNQTSDRLVSMAIALSGGDTDKADSMMDAIQKGYDKAAKAWGQDLPEISKKTLEATKQKMEDWKSGKTTAQDYSNYLQ